jgi:hypothetical protein
VRFERYSGWEREHIAALDIAPPLDGCFSGTEGHGRPGHTPTPRLFGSLRGHGHG